MSVLNRFWKRNNEVWARKMLVTETPLDRKGITGDCEKYVHLVILGMTPMGQTLAIEAAHVAHYPNCITKGKKTKITLVDVEARREMDYMTSCFNRFFDQIDYTYTEIEKGKVVFEEEFKSINPTGSFMDVEFEFIKSNVSDGLMRKKLSDWADDKEQILTIAVCFQRSAQNIATALNMPDKVYENEVMMLVKQTTSGEQFNSADNVKYRNIRSFGMKNDGCEEGDNIEKWAKNINYLYTYFYENNRIPSEYPKETVDKLWNELAVIDKWSSIFNVQTIPGKLRSIGMDYKNEDSWRTMTDEEVDLMARVEHNRWNVERLLCGYRPTNEEESEKVRRDIENNRGEKLKKFYKKRFIHYDICPYDALRDDETGLNVQRFDVGVVKGIFDIIRNGK